MESRDDDRHGARADRGSRVDQLDHGLSIVIPAYADTAMLRRAIWSVQQTTDLPFELIVALAPQCVARNRNAGLARARYDLVAFLDDDVLLPARWSSRLVAALRSSHDLGAVSARLVFPNGAPQMRCQGMAPGELWETTIPGTCFVYSRTRAGDPWFDEGYLGSQWEDTDWIWSLHRRGLRTVVCGDVVAVHDHGLRENQWLQHNIERFRTKWGRLPAPHEVASVSLEELRAWQPPPLHIITGEEQPTRDSAP